MITEFAKEIIKNADSCGAQDIYVIPRQDNYELYMRVGQERRLIDVYRPDFMASLIGHFKFVAGMMVGEKRRSQLGSCDYDCGDGHLVSLRLSTVGDYRGLESLVIRVLHSERRELTYWNQGIQPIKDALDYRGLYLFAGPVGSGKTTLMHELVQERFKGQQVISIEDPVEIKQDNVLQLQVNQAIDMTYDNLIKLSLRHRPDVLIIGEIRDKETARAVIRASLTGVTVLSTIHAKSVAGVYERLLDLGVDKSELDNALQGIAYMRLIKGGGVIDFACENFQSHSSASWNQQLEGLVKQGYLTEGDIQGEKIKGLISKSRLSALQTTSKGRFYPNRNRSLFGAKSLVERIVIISYESKLNARRQARQDVCVSGFFGQYCYSDCPC